MFCRGDKEQTRLRPNPAPNPLTAVTLKHTVCLFVLEQKCHTRHRDCPGRLRGIPGGGEFAALPESLARDSVPAMPGIHRYPGHGRHSFTLSRQDVWETFPSGTALGTDVTERTERMCCGGTTWGACRSCHLSEACPLSWRRFDYDIKI